MVEKAVAIGGGLPASWTNAEENACTRWLLVRGTVLCIVMDDEVTFLKSVVAKVWVCTAEVVVTFPASGLV